MISLSFSGLLFCPGDSNLQSKKLNQSSLVSNASSEHWGMVACLITHRNDRPLGIAVVLVKVGLVSHSVNIEDDVVGFKHSS